MGGKRKQAQRSKGNTRPSSSGRCAEKLANSGASVSGFLGFTSLQGDHTYVPAIQGNDEVDAAVDADFRLVMRKMTKRDVTTKIKAVQEFTVLCKDRDADVIKGILPYWPRLFNKLSMDHERRVREATFQAHEQLVLKSRKSLAPYLRSIMGCWLLAQCDPYGPAATAASDAFQTAFPPSKQAEAVVFCKADTLALIEDNLFHQTAETLSDPEITPVEEMEAKHQRVVASTLLGWKLFLTLVSDAEHETLHASYEKILSEKKFWKLAKNKSQLIRSSWFRLVSTLCQVLPTVMCAQAVSVCPAVLSQLDESDPAISPFVWEAAMFVLVTIDDCWQHVNARKAVLPKLWSVLQDGGRGNASAIYPNMLPFLSKVPADVVGDGIQFYQEFFTRMRSGLAKEKVQVSPSEFNAVIVSFIECLKYTLVHLAKASSPELYDLMTDQLLPVLQSCLLEPGSKLSTATCFYAALASLLRHWHRLSAEDGSSTAPTFAKLTVEFWTQFGVTCVDIVENGNAQSVSIHRLADVFLCLHDPDRYTLKRKSGAKVKFVDDGESQACAPDNKPSAPAEEDFVVEAKVGKHSLELELEDESSDVFLADEANPLHAHVRELVRQSLRHVTASKSLDHLKFVGSVVKAYAGPSLFSSLIGETDGADGDKAKSFFVEIVAPLLPLVVGSQPTGKADYADSLVNLSLAAYRCACDETQRQILSALCTAEEPYILENLLQQLLPHQNEDAVFSTWMKSQELGRTFVRLAKKLCNVTLAENEEVCVETDVIWRLLSFSLCTDGNFEPIVSSVCLGQILDMFHQTLPKPGSVVKGCGKQLTTVVLFVCDLASRLFINVKGCWQIPATEHLLLTLFLISCQPLPGLSDTVTEKIETTWLTGVQMLVSMSGGLVNAHRFFRQSALAVQHLVVTDLTSLAGSQQLATTTVKMLRQLHDSLPADDSASLVCHPVVREFLEVLLPSPDKWNELRNQLGKQWLLRVVIQGILTVDDLPQTEIRLLDQPHTNVHHIYAACFISHLLSKLVDESESAAKERTALEDDTATSPLLDNFILPHFVEIIFAQVFCRTADVRWNEDRTSENELKSLYDMLHESFGSLLAHLDDSQKTALARTLLSKSLSEGNLWSLSLHELLVLLRDSKFIGIVSAEITDRTSFTTTSELHTGEVLVRHQTFPLATYCERLCGPEMSETPLAARGIIGLVAKDLCYGDAVTDNQDNVVRIMDLLVTWRETKNSLFLFACDVSSCEWPVICFNVEIQRLVVAVIAKYSHVLTPEHWDFILCALCSWIQSCMESRSNLMTQLGVLAFAASSLSVLPRVASVMWRVSKSECAVKHPSLVTEWDEFFCEGIFSVLFPLVVGAAVEKANSKLSYSENYLLVCMANALETIPTQYIEDNSLPPKQLLADAEDAAAPSAAIPDNLATVLNHLCPLLTVSARPTQLLAFRVLMKIVPSLAKFDEDQDRSDDGEESSRPLPAALRLVLTEATAVVNSVFAEATIGASCLVEFDADSYSYILGYLLLWSLVMELFSAASSELRSQYASYLQSSGLMHDMLANLFHLIPENAALPKGYLQSGEASPTTLFAEEPRLHVAEANMAIELQHQACRVYFDAVKKLPALVRQWWNNQDKQVASLVDRITSKFVSPLLCSEELQSVQRTDKKFESMMVKARPSAREVVAVYTIDEVVMELIIKLAPNHPLGQIAVESGKRVGVSSSQWRNWMLQLNTFLMYQNGSILDGLALWKRNVDKKFEGIEECYICFYVLHGSNCQLPRVSCRTCKKKFHSACLYKWFNTSNQSTCPLCRNLF